MIHDVYIYMAHGDFLLETSGASSIIISAIQRVSIIKGDNVSKCLFGGQSWIAGHRIGAIADPGNSMPQTRLTRQMYRCGQDDGPGV
jgi:hypothetical protein